MSSGLKYTLNLTIGATVVQKPLNGRRNIRAVESPSDEIMRDDNPISSYQ